MNTPLRVSSQRAKPTAGPLSAWSIASRPVLQDIRQHGGHRDDQRCQLCDQEYEQEDRHSGKPHRRLESCLSARQVSLIAVSTLSGIGSYAPDRYTGFVSPPGLRQVADRTSRPPRRVRRVAADCASIRPRRCAFHDVDGRVDRIAHDHHGLSRPAMRVEGQKPWSARCARRKALP